MEKITRRRFLFYILGGMFSIFGISILNIFAQYVWPPKGSSGEESNTLEAGNEEDIPLNTAKIVQFKKKPVIIIHLNEGFKSFSAVCTHLGCIVKWDEQKKNIFCPCHAGFFDTDGNVISGPPPSPLQKVTVKIINRRIFLEA